jgi:hypothetical protein
MKPILEVNPVPSFISLNQASFSLQQVWVGKKLLIFLGTGGLVSNEAKNTSIARACHGL